MRKVDPTPTPILPPPSTFGVNADRFPDWRPNQDVAVQDILLADKRFVVCVGPTGFGKSLMYLTVALLSPGRTLILTSTNPLSQQLMDDFGDLGVVQVKGKANYGCRKIGRAVTCDRGPCNYGVGCQWKEGGCAYYDTIAKARGAGIVITNYAFWIYNNLQPDSDPIGTFDTIICDEAHDCPNKVADAFTVRMSTKSKTEAHLLQAFKWGEDKDGLRYWAYDAEIEAKRMLKEAKRGDRVESAFRASQAIRKVKQIKTILNTDPTGGNTVIVPEKRWGVLRVAVAWPFDKSEQVLFTSAEKVVFTSATVRRKTVAMLGVDEREVEDLEYPHIIPQHRRILYHIPTIRLNYKNEQNTILFRQWLNRHNHIARERGDWNGIFHPVSYKRAEKIKQAFKYHDRLLCPKGKELEETVRRFKGQRGKILLSPAVSTGYDFPYDTCRWQVIGKIPWPDMSDPITKARCERDEDYSPYLAMQTLVQTTGRIVRAADDWGETMVIDDNVGWFLWKYEEFAPKWFVGSYKKVSGVPKPLFDK